MITDTYIVQGDNWNELLKEVVTFNSVEEFWGIYVCHSRHAYFFLALLSWSGSNMPPLLPLEQHYTYHGTRSEGRLPPIQKGRPTRMGGPPEQARRKVVLLIPGQEERAHRRAVAACPTRRYRRDARKRGRQRSNGCGRQRAKGVLQNWHLDQERGKDHPERPER